MNVCVCVLVPHSENVLRFPPLSVSSSLKTDPSPSSDSFKTRPVPVGGDGKSDRADTSRQGDRHNRIPDMII